MTVRTLHKSADKYVCQCRDICRLSVNIFTRHVDNQKCMSMRPLISLNNFYRKIFRVGRYQKQLTYPLIMSQCKMAEGT